MAPELASNRGDPSTPSPGQTAASDPLRLSFPVRCVPGSRGWVTQPACHQGPSQASLLTLWLQLKLPPLPRQSSTKTPAQPSLCLCRLPPLPPEVGNLMLCVTQEERSNSRPCGFQFSEIQMNGEGKYRLGLTFIFPIFDTLI